MKFADEIMKCVPEDSTFDLNSMGYLIMLSGHYNREQIRILKCLDFIKEFQRIKEVSINELKIDALQNAIDNQVDEMLSSYNQLLAMEYLDRVFGGILLSNFGL